MRHGVICEYLRWHDPMDAQSMTWATGTTSGTNLPRLMALQPGCRLGPYEVLAALGAGGMGEVYRARDTKLGRDVAIKVLPDAFARDPERLARFQREAQVLASLNHPNIAQIYGLEEVGRRQGARDGTGRGADARGSHRARAPFRSMRRCPSRGRSPRRSRPRTSRASSIAI